MMQALCVSQEELALFGVQGCAVNIGETVPFSRQHETRVGMALAGRFSPHNTKKNIEIPSKKICSVAAPFYTYILYIFIDQY
jgi:hypothetical protein